MSEEDTKDILEEWKKVLFPHTYSKPKTAPKLELDLPNLSEHEKTVRDLAILELSKQYGKDYAEALVTLASMYAGKIPIFAVEKGNVYVVGVLTNLHETFFQALELLGVMTPKKGMVVLFNTPPKSSIVAVTKYAVRLGRKKRRDGSISAYVKAFEFLENSKHFEITNQLQTALKSIEHLKVHSYTIVSRSRLYGFNEEEGHYFEFHAGVKCSISGHNDLVISELCLKSFDDLLRFINMGILNVDDDTLKEILESKYYSESYNPHVESKDVKENNNYEYSIKQVFRDFFHVKAVNEKDIISFYIKMVGYYDTYDVSYYVCNPKHISVVQAFDKMYREQVIEMYFGDKK
jgi:hypothetical protein